MSIAGSTCYCPSVIYFGMCSHRWYVCRYIYIYTYIYLSFYIYIYIYLSTYTHAFDVDDIWYDMSGQVLTTSLSSHALEAWKTREVIPKCPNYSAVELSCTQKIDEYIDRSIDREMDTYIYIYCQHPPHNPPFSLSEMRLLARQMWLSSVDLVVHIHDMLWVISVLPHRGKL